MAPGSEIFPLGKTRRSAASDAAVARRRSADYLPFLLIPDPGPRIARQHPRRRRNQHRQDHADRCPAGHCNVRYQPKTPHPGRHYARHVAPGILPSALRASLRLSKIAPGDFVERLDFIARRGAADHRLHRGSAGDREDPRPRGQEDHRLTGLAPALPGIAAARLVRFAGMIPQQRFAGCADDGAVSMPAGRSQEWV